jgi:hypothetical protein
MKSMTPMLEKECMQVILDYIGIDITQAQFRELMVENPKLNKQLIKFESPGDTMDREDMMSALGRKLAGRNWPTYSQGQQAYEEFQKDFDEGAKRLGYKMVGQDVDD